jgi:hypothetical protein
VAKTTGPNKLAATRGEGQRGSGKVGQGRMVRTSDQFPRPPLGPDLADTSEAEFQDYGDFCERFG